MNASPLLASAPVEPVAEALAVPHGDERVQEILATQPRDVGVHILRFLMLRGLDGDANDRLLAVWRALIPQSSTDEPPGVRDALWHQSAWWDAFGAHSTDERSQMNKLEDLLYMVGTTAAGVEYFFWVADHPPYVRMDDIWDEHRRGAITVLGRCGYAMAGRSCELFLARHLDDWINVQTDVIDVLVGMKSRVLAKVAPWYIEHDKDVRPFLQPFFGGGPPPDAAAAGP